MARQVVVTLLALFSVAWGASAPASAQDDGRPLRGVALVIGNGDYQHLSRLPNPAGDARAVEELLARLGFETTLTSDRDARRLARDLDLFAEDAAGADVAIFFYAGHGIEAGGENFLVPVDADPSALDAAGEKLVPVSEFLGRLQRTVQVAIFILDACRDNPFPPGAAVRIDAASAPVTMGPGGLSETRGAAPLGAAPAAIDNLGTVIAFAAEPGRVALDGEPGGNSPYTAAMLRHLDAMAGEEFGTVMRIVAEEVYLRTSGAQRPWVNESLRRLLHFGAAPELPAGDEGDILSERRGLLLTISTLPSAERRRVEAIARDGEVPLDAIYAVLAALNQAVPDDPAALERLLRQQVQRLKKMQEERAVLVSTDPEIVRLAALAATALEEGALRTAISLNERAKLRVAELAGAIEDVEDQLRARRIEFAEVHARSAEAYEMASEFELAASDYAMAYDYVVHHDAGLASEYLLGQSWAVRSLGFQTGDMAQLEFAVDLAREAAEIVEDDNDYAFAMRYVGENLHLLGWSTARADLLEEAIEAFREAVAIETREDAPEEWAETQHNLGISLEFLSWLEGDAPRSRPLLEEARDHFLAAMEVRTVEQAPDLWAASAARAAVTLYRLAVLDSSIELARESIALAEQAAALVPYEDDPAGWAGIQENLAGAYQIAGQLLAETDAPAAEAYFHLAIELSLDAIETEEDSPLVAANMLNNLGGVYLDLWWVSEDPEALAGAEWAYLEALHQIDGIEADSLRKAALDGLELVREASDDVPVAEREARRE